MFFRSPCPHKERTERHTTTRKKLALDKFIQLTGFFTESGFKSINEKRYLKKHSLTYKMAEEKLVRGIGRWDFTAIVINTIIGAGIFGLPGKVYAQIGSYSLFAFALCALITGLIVLCYAEVASRFSATGGSYLYAREAFGPAVGFEVGWLFWIVRVATFAANCNLLITYLGFFISGANEGWMRIAFATLITLIITAVNLIGIRETAVMTNIVTIGKLVPLLVFAIV